MLGAFGERIFKVVLMFIRLCISQPYEIVHILIRLHCASDDSINTLGMPVLHPEHHADKHYANGKGISMFSEILRELFHKYALRINPPAGTAGLRAGRC
jgi:hypothetical protein